MKGYDLVTGGSGFLGTHLVKGLLERGHPVLVLQSGAGSKDAKETSAPLSIKGDIRTKTWWQEARGLEVARVFHLAANASVPRAAEDPGFDLITNVLGTLHALEFARQQGAQFILASTGFVYGPPHYVPMDETHPLEPTSPYGVSKLAAEAYVDFYRRTHGLDTRTLRLFNIYGPGQTRYLVFDFLRKATAPGDIFEVLGDGSQVRSQLFVSDAVRAVLLIAERGDAAPYNVGSSQGLSVLELARAVLRVSGQDKRLVTTGESWPGDIPVLLPDTARLEGLGFWPEVALKEGLRRMWAWWQARAA